MPKYLIIELREKVRNHAIEAANDHIRFVSRSLPAWAKDHEEEIHEAFRLFAVIGANEAVNSLRRQGIL